jgi:hypothetical protein
MSTEDLGENEGDQASNVCQNQNVKVLEVVGMRKVEMVRLVQ